MCPYGHFIQSARKVYFPSAIFHDFYWQGISRGDQVGHSCALQCHLLRIGHNSFKPFRRIFPLFLKIAKLAVKIILLMTGSKSGSPKVVCESLEY